MNTLLDIDKIVGYLLPLKEKLHRLYNWNAKIDRLVELQIIDNAQLISWNSLSNFEKELKIKHTLNQHLNDANSVNSVDSKFDELCLWIIKDWGGINLNKEVVKPLVNQFINKKDWGFNKIASISKVASFMFPEEFIIYDSRIAYSLNWIILKTNAGNKYFPIPEGRNSKMTSFDMNTLIHIKHANNFFTNDHQELLGKNKFISKRDQIIYFDKKDAYKRLNRLIKEISVKLWDGDLEKTQKLFYTEMLLFSIADNVIFQDIVKHFMDNNSIFQNSSE
ncbi:hypothetical protein [Sphingobacterium composti Ten et al. 2007 non Yoo et al. 2007]|uniref:hypothetical protein n=1 Tax=Sphingobacterium composti TaxID=363260 RepID=UPI00135CB85E|nr:hypothetical protein [Sphingobacterium composti Ten et al. 2007 non Yoo et al. 2007]